MRLHMRQTAEVSFFCYNMGNWNAYRDTDSVSVVQKTDCSIGLVLVSFAMAGLAALALHYLIGI